ncbi:hypothetical protein [Streptomyces sp. NPDC050422]|uniref:hypothetical protein n=1 Tax=Streptomyces sp. NPDC050422 TaxID=3365614 RepID=UPI0037937F5A
MVYSAAGERNIAYMSKFMGWVVVLALAIWSVFAFQWLDKGCDAVEAYTAVFTYGTPEGLEFLPACNS